jgi:hypothetical protein
MHPKGIAGVHDTCSMVKAEHGVWPMQVGGHHKLQHMTPTQVNLITSFHGLLLEGPVGKEQHGAAPATGSPWQRAPKKASNVYNENCRPIHAPFALELFGADVNYTYKLSFAQASSRDARTNRSTMVVQD